MTNGALERLKRVLEDLEEEQCLNSECQQYDATLDIAVIALREIVSREDDPEPVTAEEEGRRPVKVPDVCCEVGCNNFVLRPAKRCKSCLERLPRISEPFRE